MVGCAICGAKDPSNLCASCAAELDCPVPFIAEQVLFAAAKPVGPALLDVWGRAHLLEEVTPIGRTPVARGLTLIHASVSRRHAELRGNVLHDLGSSNGTRVNDEPLAGPRALVSGDRLSFGAIGFYYAIGTRIHADAEPHLGSRTLRPEDAPRAEKLATPSDSTHAGLPQLGFKLLEPTAGGGGYLLAVGQELQLTDTQLALLRILADRMLAEPDTSSLVRGFVPSGQLIADLPWDSLEPDENNLKQLVRRVRRMLEGIRLAGLIESRRGLGYRLRCIPVEDSK